MLLILFYDRCKEVSGLDLVLFEGAIDQFDIIFIVNANGAGTKIFSFYDPVFKCWNLIILRGGEDLSSFGGTFNDIYSNADLIHLIKKHDQLKRVH